MTDHQHLRPKGVRPQWGQSPGLVPHGADDHTSQNRSPSEQPPLQAGQRPHVVRGCGRGARADRFYPHGDFTKLEGSRGPPGGDLTGEGTAAGEQPHVHPELRALLSQGPPGFSRGPHTPRVSLEERDMPCAKTAVTWKAGVEMMWPQATQHREPGAPGAGRGRWEPPTADISLGWHSVSRPWVCGHLQHWSQETKPLWSKTHQAPHTSPRQVLEPAGAADTASSV